MTCYDLKEYKPQLYENLHNTFSLVNRNDDYDTFYQKWGKWNQLKNRFVGNKI